MEQETPEEFVPTNMAEFVQHMENRHGLPWQTILDYYCARRERKYKKELVEEMQMGNETDQFWLPWKSYHDFQEDLPSLECKIKEMLQLHGTKIQMAAKDMFRHKHIWMRGEYQGEVEAYSFPLS